MIMVTHETIGMNNGFVTHDSAFQIRKKPLFILIVTIYRSLLIPACGHVIKGVLVFNSKRSCHFEQSFYPNSASCVNCVDLTLSRQPVDIPMKKY
jgi:hypothetical protein